MRCTKLSSPGVYLIHDVPDGVYHLRAAAFPVAADPRSPLLPGDPDLVLQPPRLTDPPLVMGLPLL